MTLPTHQRTIAKMVNCSGIGLHSGKTVNLTLKSAPVNHGIKFIRKDLPDNPIVSARFNCVVDTSLATVIGSDGVIVSTIEHLMACLAGLSVDNIIVELDSYEVPVMDGSAGPFTRMIMKAGIQEQDAPRHFFVLKEPIELAQDGKYVGAYPDSTFKMTCNIEFEHPLIRKQSCCIEVLDRIFEREISRARTFGFLHEVEYMKNYGLARGGSLDNAVVIKENAILNKIADLLGYIKLTTQVCSTAQRRVIHGETVPNEEKIFSIFETHTQLYRRGKQAEPNQFGRLVMVYEDGAGFISHHHLLPRDAQDADVVVEETRIAQKRHKGQIEDASFDRGFYSPENERHLKSIIEHACMPKRATGPFADQMKNASVRFHQARQRHPGIESAIGALQFGNGLERSRDRTEVGFERYIGLAILGRNLHVLGKLLIQRQDPETAAAQSRRKPAA